MLKNFKLLKNLKYTFSFKDAFAILIAVIRKKEIINIPSNKIKIKLRNNTKDKETFLEIFSDLMYQTPITFQPQNIIDAGANVGFASLFFKIKFPNSKIVALEIDKENIACLKYNLFRFNDIFIYEKALYNRMAHFKIENPYHANNSYVIKEVNSDESFDVESITLDKIMKDLNWTYIDILKIDIEGSEKDLFSKNYQNWLPKTKVIYVETHDRMIPQCSATVTNTINIYEEFILYTATTGTLVYYNTQLMEIP